MDTQNVISAPTRRNLFTGVAGLTASSVIAYGLLHQDRPHPDGELLAMVERFAAADAKQTDDYFAGMEAVTAMNLPRAEDTKRRTAVMVALRPTDAELDALLHEIGTTQARTADGLAAKARLMHRWLADGWNEVREPTENGWERVCWSLARDLMARSAVA